MSSFIDVDQAYISFLAQPHLAHDTGRPWHGPHTKRTAYDTARTWHGPPITQPTHETARPWHGPHTKRTAYMTRLAHDAARPSLDPHSTWPAHHTTPTSHDPLITRPPHHTLCVPIVFEHQGTYDNFGERDTHPSISILWLLPDEIFEKLSFICFRVD